jgi:hypothetical protein
MQVGPISAGAEMGLGIQAKAERFEYSRYRRPELL